MYATVKQSAPSPQSDSGDPVAAVELPTLLLLLGTYGSWLGLTLAYGQWPLLLIAPLLVVVITLHSSLQHEILHGHPTRYRGINRALGMPPLSLWLPYDRYRSIHLQHHIDERLTDPLDDTESFYWRPEDWRQLNAFSRAALRFQQTLAGRVLLGPIWRPALFLLSEWRSVLRNDAGLRRAWLTHMLWCVPVILWLKLVCGMPLWLYLIAMVIPSYSLILTRSFAEHRALPELRKRVAIVEGSWILGPLYLFNNLHALHHETPGIPWYQYPDRYRRERERLIRENGGLVYSTYFDVARRYLFRAHDTILHPTGGVPRDNAEPPHTQLPVTGNV